MVILFLYLLSLGVAPPIQKSGKSGKPGTPLSLALLLNERVGDFFEAAEDDGVVAVAVSMDMSRIEQQYNPGCKSLLGSGTVESSMLVTTEGPIDRPREIIRARSLSISLSSMIATGVVPVFFVGFMSAMVWSWVMVSAFCDGGGLSRVCLSLLSPKASAKKKNLN